MTRSRLFLVVAALAAFFVGGFAVAWSQTGEPTVETQTFTNVVTYTVPTVTETTVSTETVTTTMTETVTAPTTTEPPPTTTEPEPPTGTHIGPVTSGEWVCNQHVLNYAPAGLPLIVETRIANAQSGVNGSVRLLAGCEGQPGVDPDIILQVHGNGGSIGDGGDAIHMGVSPGPQNLQITGFANCGAPNGSSHPDGVQMLWARNVTFHDFELGDWETQTATCHGAGGLFYVSESPATDLVNVVCVRCKMVGSTGFGSGVGTGFYLGGSTDSGAILSCFSSNRPFFSDGQAVRGLNIDNVFIDRDSSDPQPAPSECSA